jgi:hypothetical protein
VRRSGGVWAERVESKVSRARRFGGRGGRCAQHKRKELAVNKYKRKGHACVNKLFRLEKLVAAVKVRQ